jgi:hypothetical protein
MQLTIISNVSEFTANEQKALYNDGADIATGLYYLVAEAQAFTIQGREVVPNLPALRSLSASSNISWIITNFRGNRIAFGSASAS